MARGHAPPTPPRTDTTLGHSSFLQYARRPCRVSFLSALVLPPPSTSDVPRLLVGAAAVEARQSSSRGLGFFLFLLLWWPLTPSYLLLSFTRRVALPVQCVIRSVGEEKEERSGLLKLRDLRDTFEEEEEEGGAEERRNKCLTAQPTPHV